MYLYWKKEWATPAAVGVVSFAAGFGAGLLFWRRHNDRQLEVAIAALPYIQKGLADATILDGDELSSDFKVVEETVTTTETEIKVDIPDRELAPDPGEPEPETHNVFEDDWDVAEQMASRTPDAPYIIHVNEFVNRESQYHQSQLEWYEGDSILCDENNVPIYNPDSIVGELKWGLGSNDPNVVYIRNEQRRAEYEITRSEGSYTYEVLGLEAEQEAEENDLKHSNHIRRFRPSD